MAAELSAMRTPVETASVIRAYEDAYTSLTGYSPPAGAAQLLAAHSGQETGGWGKHFWNFNLGNITSSGPGDTFDYVHRPDCKPPSSMPTDPYAIAKACPSRFRAYGSLAEGATDHLRWVLHHHGGRAAVDSADPAAFVAVLRAGGYIVSSASAAADKVYGEVLAGINSWLSKISGVASADSPHRATAPVVGGGGPSTGLVLVGATLLIAGTAWGVHEYRKSRRGRR